MNINDILAIAAEAAMEANAAASRAKAVWDALPDVKAAIEAAEEEDEAPAELSEVLQKVRDSWMSACAASAAAAYIKIANDPYVEAELVGTVLRHERDATEAARIAIRGITKALTWFESRR